MSARVPLVILPRELGQVPPPLELIGHKARGLAQLLALKARVPRFGILTADAFDAHVNQHDIQATVRAAKHSGFEDEASRLAHGEAMVRAVLRNPLPVSVRIGVHELLSSFSEEDVLVVRASVVGDTPEAAVVTGALDSALGVRGKEALEEAILRIFALAFHPRTLNLRDAAGYPPLGLRLAVVVQRMILSDSSGVCVSLETAERDGPARTPKSYIRGCWGLAGGIGGRHGNARIPCDVLRVERPAVALDELGDDARVEMDLALKLEALKLDDKKGTRMQPLGDHAKKEPCLSTVQARMIAREALRLEAAFGKPQVVSWAFAGRLMHILDVEPLLIPVERVESNRARTWDDRLLPTGLLSTTSPLTFSVWQKAAARGMERAGRILGVKGVILEDTRPQMPRVLGHVGGRMYANVEVLTALLDLLPFADKARAAVAAATGQVEIVPRKAPPPGFWQRQRQKLDEGRWPGQLEKIGEVAASESERFRGEVETTLQNLGVLNFAKADPDALIDAFDELEDALSKSLGAIALSGLAAALYRKELEDAAQDPELAAHPGLISDLLGGEVPGDLIEPSRRLFQWAQLARGRVGMKRVLERHKGRFDALAERVLSDDVELDLDDDEHRLGLELRAFLKSAPCTGDLAVESPRLFERPDLVLEMLARLVDTDADNDTLDTLARTANGARKKAEYLFENLKLKSSSTKKRFQHALDGTRRHGRDAALLWMPCELVVARLRACAVALGQRLFEHGLLDQPRDVLFLEGREVSGLIRGTGIDQDGKPLVAARKRQASTTPTGLPRRVETRGVVATSLIDDDDDHVITAPTDAKELSGRSIAAGVVQDESILLDGNPLKPSAPPVPQGIVVVRTATLRDLPLLLVAKAVVAERGTTLGPAPYTLRALGVPAVVDAPQATSAFNEREPLYVDGGRGVVRRVVRLPEKKPGDAVDASLFAREAVLSDPRKKVPANVRPAPPLGEIVAPPIVKPRPGYIVPSGEITDIENNSGETSIEDDDIIDEEPSLIPPARR